MGTRVQTFTCLRLTIRDTYLIKQSLLHATSDTHFQIFAMIHVRACQPTARGCRPDFHGTFCAAFCISKGDTSCGGAVVLSSGVRDQHCGPAARRMRYRAHVTSLRTTVFHPRRPNIALTIINTNSQLYQTRLNTEARTSFSSTCAIRNQAFPMCPLQENVSESRCRCGRFRTYRLGNCKRTSLR